MSLLHFHFLKIIICFPDNNKKADGIPTSNVSLSVSLSGQYWSMVTLFKGHHRPALAVADDTKPFHPIQGWMM